MCWLCFPHLYISAGCTIWLLAVRIEYVLTYFVERKQCQPLNMSIYRNILISLVLCHSSQSILLVMDCCVSICIYKTTIFMYKFKLNIMMIWWNLKWLYLHLYDGLYLLRFKCGVLFGFSYRKLMRYSI